MSASKPSHLSQQLKGTKGPIVAVSDWTHELPSMLGRFIEQRYVCLGTSGYGRSDTREALRRHFEIDAASITFAALHALVADNELDADVLSGALQDLGINPKAPNPMSV